MPITFETDHIKTWFLILDICFHHAEIHWNKNQSCVTTSYLHKYNMAAMQGKIPTKNAMKHEWKHEKYKKFNAFWKTKIQFILVKSSTKDPFSGWIGINSCISKIDIYNVSSNVSLFKFLVTCNHAWYAWMTKGHIESKAVMCDYSKFL